MGKLGTAGIVGLALAPFTGGASLALTAGEQISAAMKPEKPKAPPDPSLMDTDAAVARDAERRRLAAGSGSRSTVLSGKAANALGSAIGRQTLGGAR